MKRRETAGLLGSGAWVLLGLLLRMVPGIRFSANLCLCLGGLWLFWLALCRLAEKHGVFRWWKRAFLLLIAAAGVVLLAAEAAVLAGGAEDGSAQPVDAVIVLGAGVNGETPSLTLQTRIRRAETYLALHPDVPVVLSGGQGPGEDITEAECMRRALASVGARRLFLEEQSTSTAENFAFSKEILEAQGIETDTAVIGVVSNDFHLFRAGLIARREGLSIVGIPAELPWWWLEANYYLRESFAVIKAVIFD